MVTIRTVSPAATDNNNCGCIELSIGVTIWFSDIHELKTEKEAQMVADNIIDALNEVERCKDKFINAEMDFDRDTVHFFHGLNGEFEIIVHLYEIHEHINEMGYNFVYTSEDDGYTEPASEVLKRNPQILEEYFRDVLQPKIK